MNQLGWKKVFPNFEKKHLLWKGFTIDIQNVPVMFNYTQTKK